MSTVSFPVPKEEYAKRIDMCKNKCAERGLDGLIVMGKVPDRNSSLNWLSNYKPWLSSTPTIYNHRGRGYGAVIIPLDGDPMLIASAPYYAKDSVSIERAMGGTNVPKLISEALVELGLDKSNLGIVGEDILYVILYKDFLKLNPMVNFTFVDDLVTNLRMVKSPIEQEIMKDGAKIGHRAALKALEFLKSGKTEADVAQAVRQSLSSAGVDEARSNVQSGVARSGEPLRYPYFTDRVLEEGDLLHIEIIGTYKGYQIDLCRAGIVGNCNKFVKEKKELLNVVFDMGLAIARAAAPGKSAEYLQEVAASIAVKKGWGKYHNQPYGGIGTYVGHGLGIGADEPPVLALGDKTILRSGMILAIEPGLYNTPYGGARIERTLLITDNGATILDDFEDGWW